MESFSTHQLAPSNDSILISMNFVLRVVSGPEGLGKKITFDADRPFVVGREQGSDAVFSGDLLLSSNHFSILSSEGQVFLTDLGSTNGTYVNDTRILRARVYPGDAIRAGTTIFELTHDALYPLTDFNASARLPVGRLTITSDHGDARSVRLGESLTVGRTEMAEWVFSDDLKMSSAHFSIESQGNLWKIRDLNSTNGTFVNNKKVADSPLQSDDFINAGSTRFSITIAGLNDSAPKPLVERGPHETKDSFSAPPIPTIVDESDFGTPLIRPSTRSPHEHLASPKNDLKASTDLAPPDASQNQVSKPSIPFRITLYCLSNPALSADYDRGQEITIGREPHNDLAFPSDVLVSGTHARLRVLNDQVVLQDLQSRNGTLVNGVRIQEEPLGHGGRFSIGKQQFKIGFVGHVDDAEPIEAPLPSVGFTEPKPIVIPHSRDGIEKDVQPKIKSVTSRLPIARGEVLPIADLEIPFESFPCGSGLVLFGGCMPSFDPIDIARRLTLATPGWLMHPKIAEATLPDSKKTQATLERELNIEQISATDPSWMIPWSERWGTQTTLIVYSRSEPKEIKQAIKSICTALETAADQIPSHDQIFDFLANRLSDTITRIFAPLDAVLIEMYAGKQWAYFGPKDMEATLRELRFRKKHRW